MVRSSLVIIASAAAALAVAQGALAADLPVKARPYVAAPQATWTGCYIGGHLGYGWSSAKDKTLPGAVSNDIGGPAGLGDPIVFGYDGNVDADGVAGGIQGGCDKQFGQAVFGVVIDYSWTSQKGNSGAFQIAPSTPALGGAETASINLKSYGTARARLGYVVSPDVMIYGTGGVAWARAAYSVTGEVNSGGTVLGLAVSDTSNFVGWAAGIGGEWRFAPNWTFGVEYLHLDFGDANFRFAGFPNFTTMDALGITGSKVELTSDVVRGTVNYRF